MFFTVPSLSPIFTYSPVRIGLKSSRMNPPTRLPSTPCRARLIATPAEPTSVMIEVMGTPMVFTAVRITRTYRRTRIRFLMKPRSVASIFILCSLRSMSLIIQ